MTKTVSIHGVWLIAPLGPIVIRSCQAHTAIKNSGALQRETEARITQAHQELAAEQERVRRAREDRAAAEARWNDEVSCSEESVGTRTV